MAVLELCRPSKLFSSQQQKNTPPPNKKSQHKTPSMPCLIREFFFVLSEFGGVTCQGLRQNLTQQLWLAWDSLCTRLASNSEASSCSCAECLVCVEARRGSQITRNCGYRQ
uniref:Uncharacterized protein n=1 Tax=Mus musculus TaxID=10090 RepID=O88605_MOUSE|nr:unknown [Mus musculus]